MSKSLFFKTPLDFNNWLAKNHEKETELTVCYYKVKTKKKSITWPESVDEALCYGWIDGIRKSIDEEAYSVRFTPRKSNSIWSAVNVKKMEELLAQKRVHQKGIEIYEQRTDKNSPGYSFKNDIIELPDEYEQQFKDNPFAWEFFNQQSSWYQTQMKWRITSAKQEKTKLARLQKLITASEEGKRLT